MVGKSISYYEITEKIGEGGTGIVYRARDTKLGWGRYAGSSLAADSHRLGSRAHHGPDHVATEDQ